MPGLAMNYDADGWPTLDGQNLGSVIDDWTVASMAKVKAELAARPVIQIDEDGTPFLVL